MKRQRGRGRKPGGGGHQNPNKAYDSHGPDVRVRGSAQTIFEKYQTLARDSLSAGDRILAENYLQHAEHYLRLIKSMQPNFIPRADIMVSGYAGEGEDGFIEDDEYDDADNLIDNSYQGNGNGNGGYQQRRDFQPRDQREPREQRDQREPREQRDSRDQREMRDQREPREPRGEPRDGMEADADGERRFGRNRNRRRDRFRNGYEGDRPAGQAGGGDGDERDGGDAPRDPLAVQRFDDQSVQPAAEVQGFEPAEGSDAAPRAPRRPRPPRPERAPRPPRDEASGFGDSVPSFLTQAPPTSVD